MLRDDLAELELRDCRRREMSGGAKYTESAEHMISISTQSSPSPKDRKQWDLVLKIRHLLKDYSKLEIYDIDRRVLIVLLEL
jgi:hypothetical protein